MDRRTFLKSGASLSALSLSHGAFAAPVTKIPRVGLIGTGWYGKVDLLRLIQVAPVEVVGLCDVDSKMVADTKVTPKKPAPVSLTIDAPRGLHVLSISFMNPFSEPPEAEPAKDAKPAAPGQKPKKPAGPRVRALQLVSLEMKGPRQGTQTPAHRAIFIAKPDPKNKDLATAERDAAKQILAGPNVGRLVGGVILSHHGAATFGRQVILIAAVADILADKLFRASIVVGCVDEINAAVEHSVQDGRITSTGKPHTISEKLQFASIGRTGDAVNAGIAPHLNLRPAKAEEIHLVQDLLDADRLGVVMEPDRGAEMSRELPLGG